MWKPKSTVQHDIGWPGEGRQDGAMVAPSGWTKEFLAMVGPEHVMGLAIGNELELLHNHVPRQQNAC